MNFFKKLYATRTASTRSLDALKSEQIREDLEETGRSSLESSPSENFLNLKFSSKSKGGDSVLQSGANPFADLGSRSPARRPSMCLSYATIVRFVPGDKRSDRKEKVLTIREVKVNSSKHMSEVLPGLYLGSKDAAHDLNTLKEFKITHVLNVTEEVDVKHSDKLVKTLKIPVKDLPSCDIVVHFQVAFDFIDESRFGPRSSSLTSPARKGGGRNKSRHGGHHAPVNEGTVDELEDVIGGLTSLPDGDKKAESSPKKGKKQPTRVESTRKSCCGSVLVHCYYGVSRSATVVLGYLMEREGMSLEDALRYLRMVRPQVKPNDGFMKQLKRYQEGLPTRLK